jgi:serine protease AprX
MHGDLAAVLRRAAADELIPVKAILTAQVPRQQVDLARNVRDRGQRRAHVTGMLKALADRTQGDILAFLRERQAGGAVGPRIRTVWMVNVVAADVTPAVAYALASREDVDLLAHNPLVEIFDDPEVVEEPEAFAAVECGVERMNVPQVWSELDIIGRGAIVAMIDSGTCYRHPDLANQIWNNPGEIPNNGLDDDNNGFIDDTIGWNFRLNNNNPDDFLGHGTHTGGTVAGDGTGGTQTGVAPGAKLMLLCVSGSFSDEVMVWNAMEYSVDNGAHAWNMSLGWPHNRSPIRATWRDLCLNAMAAGLTPVIAAGNEGTCCPPYDHTRTPGDVPEVVTAGAVDCNDNVASFSSRGPVTWQNVDPYNDWPYPPGKLKPTVSAGGVSTTSTRMCSGYTALSGTSMATPHVAGAVALIVEANPNLTPEEIKQILIDTATDRGDPGRDNVYGAGRVNAYAAVVAALDANDRVTPDSFRVTRGQLVSGDLSDLTRADDGYIEVEARMPDEVAAASVEIEVEGTAPSDDPIELSFTLEAATSGIPTRQRIEMYDFDAGQWEQVDERDGPAVDTEVAVTINTDAGRFIDDATLKVRTRIGYHDRGVTFLGWGGRFDATYWTLVEN